MAFYRKVCAKAYLWHVELRLVLQVNFLLAKFCFCLSWGCSNNQSGGDADSGHPNSLRTDSNRELTTCWQTHWSTSSLYQTEGSYS